MNKDKESYKQIMKATSIFGGVQVFEILIRIIRSKFIAVLLGPEGMGIAGLLNSTIGVVSSITNFGLQTSAIKDIAKASTSNDLIEISKTVKTVKRLVWLTGLLGAVIIFVFSSWFSRITFGNTDYTFAFMWISITLLLNQISTGQRVVLQGFRKLAYLAKSSLLGSVFGLVIVIPIYYIYGIDGIVPGIIITSTITLVLSWYFSRKIKIENINLSFAEIFSNGRNMMTMGFMISLSGFLGMGSAFLIRIFISNTGGVNEVGLFTAGFAIINTYVGLVFTAMGTDFYPRLSSVASDDVLVSKTINQQAEIALLILGPILIIFMVFIKWVVILLYSAKFVDINEMIYWAVMGIFFKAVSWSIGFIFLAKGESKIYFWNELLVNLYTLAFNIFGYYYYGLTGLGISFMLSYFVYLIQVYIISKKKFNFNFSKGVIKIFSIQFSLAIVVFLLVNFFYGSYSYIFGSVFVVIGSIYSFRELDNRMDVMTLIKKIIKK